MAKKAKNKPNPTAETLAELEATGDRLTEWASEHAAVILGVIAAILVLAAAVGFYVQHGSDARDQAANALAIASSQYRQAMGADPAGGPIPEPANPELGQRTRSEFADRFAALGREHANTSAGAIAWLKAGALQVELDRDDDARASFEAARRAAGKTAASAIASTRLAALAERQGDPVAAAEAFESAAAVTAYPLRAAALADAARCWADAGETQRALEAYQRLESEFPDELAPPHVAARIAELRLQSGS